MKIYLASPLFTLAEKKQIEYWAQKFREFGDEVYVPMEHQILNAYEIPNHEWAKKVFEADIKALKECDKVVCIYYGLYSDSGTAWECGFAYGIGKPVEIIDYSGKEMSLMVVQGSEIPNRFKNKYQT